MITEKLQPGLKVIFIGFNPSLTSYARGYNYAGRNNRFYRILYETGLTDRLYRPEESPHLIDVGYGFTNIVSRPTKQAADIRPEEYDVGRRLLREKLAQFRPTVACFVGKGVYTQFARKRGSDVLWGFQREGVVAGVRDFVGPSSSGLVRMKLAEQVAIYAELARFLTEQTKSGATDC